MLGFWFRCPLCVGRCLTSKEACKECWIVLQILSGVCEGARCKVQGARCKGDGRGPTIRCGERKGEECDYE